MPDATKKEGADRTALITGASSGIGKAFAKVFAENGFDLVLTARRESHLRETAKQLEDAYDVKTLVVTADLADPAAPKRIFDEIHAKGLHIDALVNNAGFGVPGYLDQSDWTRHREFLEVTTAAPVHLAHLAAPVMVERGYGRIINVASISGFLPPHPGGTLYYPAKSFLIKFSLAHAAELAGTGVHVTAICPGFTRTNFQQASGTSVEVVTMPDFLWMSPDEVAAQSYRAVMAGDPVYVNGLVNRLMVIFFKYLPDSIGRWLVLRTAKQRP
jgi:short-subunit dehydrogenase